MQSSEPLKGSELFSLPVKNLTKKRAVHLTKSV